MFPQLFGKYVLERELAQGGMARVYLATLRGAVGFEKRLVVKQIRTELASDDAFVQRFVEEAKTAVELSHPNIVPVYELGVEQGVYYIAMELCTGVTLAELLRDSGKLSAEEGAYVGVEICRALDYAHRRAGIVHRDVTPRNVLVDEEGAVRLIDFGIAAPVADTGCGKGEVFGSPGHMPPEQIEGAALTPASDVFAVAALLVEVWSARPPFRRATARESHAALAEPIALVSEHDPKLGALAPHIRAALARDPRERPGDAEIFARPLRDFLRSVDSGDVARHLGARVLRAKSRAPRPSTRTADAPETAVSRAEAPLTRTFAARHEVEAWTRRIHSEPPHPTSGPGTRKLPSLPPSARVFAIRASAFIAVLLAGAAALWLARAPTTAANTALPTALGGPGSAGRLRAAPSAVLPALPSSAQRAETSASAPRPPSSPSAPRATAVLRLTADPGANVTVHGMGQRRALETPVRELKVVPGSYTVTFRSATYEAPLVTRVDALGGTVLRVHADFREADPHLTVR